MNYKTDKDIEAEFADFTVKNVSIDTTRAHLDSKSGYITVVWPHGDESVCGGVENYSETVDSWIDYNGDGKRIAFDSWYPDSVYSALCDAVRKACCK